jgi:hypothetical protein
MNESNKLEHTKPIVQNIVGVNGLEDEADHSPPASAELTSTSSYIFIATCLSTGTTLECYGAVTFVHC